MTSYTPADFAFVYVRDPEMYQSAASLFMSPRRIVAAAGLVSGGITDVPARKPGYSLITYARSGVYGLSTAPDGRQTTYDSISGADVPRGLVLFSSTNPREGITEHEPGNSLAGMYGGSGWAVIRMLPVPADGPVVTVTGSGTTTPTILGNRPSAFMGGSTSVTLNFDSWRVDNVLSAMPGTGVPAGGTWLEAYIAVWESLATSHPILNRRPALGLRFGQKWYGIGDTCLTLSEVTVNRDYFERGVTASAVLSLRFEEVAWKHG